MSVRVDIRSCLTVERLRELLHYDPETGVFRWIKPSSPKSRAEVGGIAGGPNSYGYWVITIDSRTYFLHRLAFLYMTGRWPAAELDHINRVNDDNRWTNLREATRGQNNSNRRIPVTSYAGVDKYCSGWRSRCKIEGIRFYTFAETALHAAWERELFLFKMGDTFALRNFPEWWATHDEEDPYDELRDLALA